MIDRKSCHIPFNRYLVEVVIKHCECLKIYSQIMDCGIERRAEKNTQIKTENLKYLLN